MKTILPYFSQNPLNRLDQVRRDSEEVYSLIHCESARFLLFDGIHIIIDETKRDCFFDKSVLDEYMISDNQVVLLGAMNGLTYFALTLKEELHENLRKVLLREFVRWDFIPQEQLGILSQASSLLQWHESHKFCSSCGHATILTQAGNRRDCLNCEKEHFPRIDSVVIMLVTFGEYCLLGRSHHFKEGFYSCLAGYVELGETLEDAAKRELFEEVGIKAVNVKYIMSQPWPFPTTLMFGMKAEATSQLLNLDSHEIEDAIWVHKKDVKEVLEGSNEYHFKVPSKVAIARNLLELWVNE